MKQRTNRKKIRKGKYSKRRVSKRYQNRLTRRKYKNGRYKSGNRKKSKRKKKTKLKNKRLFRGGSQLAIPPAAAEAVVNSTDQVLLPGDDDRDQPVDPESTYTTGLGDPVKLQSDNTSVPFPPEQGIKPPPPPPPILAPPFNTSSIQAGSSPSEVSREVGSSLVAVAGSGAADPRESPGWSENLRSSLRVVAGSRAADSSTELVDTLLEPPNQTRVELPPETIGFLRRTDLDQTPLVNQSIEFVLDIYQTCVNLENVRPSSESPLQRYQRFATSYGADADSWSQDLEYLEELIGVRDDSDSGSGSWNDIRLIITGEEEGNRVDEGGSGEQLTPTTPVQPGPAARLSMSDKAKEAADRRISECMLQMCVQRGACWSALFSSSPEPEPEPEPQVDEQLGLVKENKRGGPGVGDKPGPDRVALAVGAAILVMVSIFLALARHEKKKRARVHAVYDVENPNPDTEARRLANAQLANEQLVRWNIQEKGDAERVAQIRARIGAEDARRVRNRDDRPPVDSFGAAAVASAVAEGGDNIERTELLCLHSGLELMRGLGSDVSESEAGLITDIEGELAEHSRLSGQRPELLSPTAPPQVVGGFDPKSELNPDELNKDED